MSVSSRLHLVLFAICVGATAAWTGRATHRGSRGMSSLALMTPMQHVCTPPLRNAVAANKGFGRAPSRCLVLHVQATMDDASSSSQHHVVVLSERTTAEAVALPVIKHGFQPEDTDIDKLKQRIINGLFLAASFGYALYTILNIDHGMTRGWTNEEMLLRIPVDNWNNYETSLAEKPIFTKTLINVIIYLLGDWLSQTIFQKKHALDFDVTRTVRNGFIGLCFGPLVHQYYEWSDHILPVEGGIWNRVEKILMDQTLYLVVKCSIYISAVGLLKGDSWQDVKQNVQDRIGGIVITAWKFWPLIHCITYGLIPARHRILWVNSVDLIWNAILASKAQPEPEPELEIQTSALVVDEGLMEITLVETEAMTDTPSLITEVVPLTIESESKVETVFRGYDDNNEAVPLVEVSLSRNTTITMDVPVSS